MIARLRSGNLVLDLGDIHPASAAICVALSKFLDLSSFRFLPFPEVRWVKPVFYFLKKLECNCFTIFCSSLLYNKVNQLYVYISPVPQEPPSRPSSSSQSTELSSRCCTAASHQLVCLTFGRVYMLVLLSRFTQPPPPHRWVLISLFYVCISIPSLQIGSSVTFF